jgi:hypothetical protein
VERSPIARSRDEALALASSVGADDPFEVLVLPEPEPVDPPAEQALYRIVLVRLRHDRRTRAYMRRRTTEGLTKTEVIRCLKRYVAREVFSVLHNSVEVVGQAV